MGRATLWRRGLGDAGRGKEMRGFGGERSGYQYGLSGAESVQGGRRIGHDE